MKTMAALLLAALVAGCNDAEYSTLGTHAFINESLSASSDKVVIDPTTGADAKVTVALSAAAEEDCEFRLVVDEAVLNKFNEEQSSSYLTLPEEVLQMEKTVRIEKGKAISDIVNIHIDPLPKEYAGEIYALPLRVESVDGAVPTTSKTATFVITTESITMSTLPMFDGASHLIADGFPVSLPQFTIECRFQVSNTGNRNRDIFSCGSPVLLRFEDPQNDQNGTPAHSLIQFQGDGWYLNPTDYIRKDKWQHYAITYDGTAVTIYVNGEFAGSKEGTIAPEFEKASWFGGGSSGQGGHGLDDSWWRGCKILCSEMRIWSVCRSATQIKNNMTTTSSKSKDLVAYWRMNEGTGNVFEDCSGNNHTLRTDKTPTWIPGILSTDTETAWPN